jgi:hypothetical protein
VARLCTPQSTQSGNRTLSGGLSIMMEKLAQNGEGGGARPPPFTISVITYKVVMNARAERADLLPLFLIYPYTYTLTPCSIHLILQSPNFERLKVPKCENFHRTDFFDFFTIKPL